MAADNESARRVNFLAGTPRAVPERPRLVIASDSSEEKIRPVNKTSLHSLI